MRVPGLAQRRAGRQQLDAQCVLVELVAPMVLDSVKVALALHEQSELAAKDAAVGYACAHRQRLVQQFEYRLEALEMVPYQRQSGHRGEVTDSGT